MNYFQLAVSVWISASLLPGLTFASVLSKDELISPPIAEGYDWTGFYAGIDLGLVKQTMNITDTQATTFYATLQQEFNPRFIGGFQLGYRHQINPARVTAIYGLEFNANFSDSKSTREYGSPFALYQLSTVNQLKNLHLIEFLAGIAVEQSFFFMGAGFSWTQVNGYVSNINGIPYFNSFTLNSRRISPALSAGVEYAFSDKISARFKVDAVSTNAYSAYDNTSNTYQISNTITQGTFGINYKVC